MHLAGGGRGNKRVAVEEGFDVKSITTLTNSLIQVVIRHDINVCRTGSY